MRTSYGWILGAIAAVLCAGATRAHAEPAIVLEIRYTPVARAQIAIWIEDDESRFMANAARCSELELESGILRASRE